MYSLDCSERGPVSCVLGYQGMSDVVEASWNRRRKRLKSRGVRVEEETLDVKGFGRRSWLVRTCVSAIRRVNDGDPLTGGDSHMAKVLVRLSARARCFICCLGTIRRFSAGLLSTNTTHLERTTLLAYIRFTRLNRVGDVFGPRHGLQVALPSVMERCWVVALHPSVVIAQ